MAVGFILFFILGSPVWSQVGPSRPLLEEYGPVSAAQCSPYTFSMHPGVRELEAHMFCQDLPVGGKLIVDKDRFRSPSGADQRFRLQRPDEKTYAVDLRLDFYPEADYDGPHQESSALSSAMKNHVSSCLKEAEPYLKGPGGEQLQIRLSEEAEVPQTRIGVKSSFHRTNAEKYASNVDCATVLHELMHLLGLVDEYEETQMQQAGMIIDPTSGELVNIAAYNCRALGPEDSLMNNPWKSYENTKPVYKYETVQCSCAQDPQQCRNYLAQNYTTAFSLKSCPAGFAQKPVEFQAPFKIKAGVGGGMGMGMGGMAAPVMGLLPTDFPLISIPPKPLGTLRPSRPSLLYPAQFNMIVKPLCIEKNRTYLQCGRMAYRSWKGSKEECGNLPQCQNPEGWVR